jgi:hypothetical protein
MRENSILMLIFCSFSSSACGDDRPVPDLESISRDYCTVVQMCNPEADFPSQDECENNSAEEFSMVREGDPACFDARMMWESCVGMLKGCTEYDQYLHAMGTKCLEERGDFYNYFMVI